LEVFCFPREPDIFDDLLFVDELFAFTAEKLSLHERLMLTSFLPMNF